MSAGWKESLTLEETNKVRVSLGLKPITADAPTKGPDALAEDNFAKRREQESKDRDTAALKAKLDRAKNERERKKKLVGIGLGEDEEAETSTKDWVKKNKRRVKEEAARRSRELEEMRKRFAEKGLANYGEDDLAGLKVAHGAEAFEEGEDVVLTLKDSRVLDDEDDELHNVNLSEHQKYAESVALKKKGRQAGQYTGIDDDEFEGAPGSRRSLLKKYDEVIEGREEDGFRLGAPVAPSFREGAPIANGNKVDKVEERERVKLSMDYAKSFNTDYLQEGDVGFKKPKKKKKRPTRPMGAKGSDDEGMDVDGSTSTLPVTAVVRQNFDEANLIDDDELQASLARARRIQSRTRISQMQSRLDTPDSMEVDQVKVETSDEETVGAGVMVLDDTSEFVNRIRTDNSVSATNGVVRKKDDPGQQSLMPRVKEEPLEESITELGGWQPARIEEEEDQDDIDLDQPPLDSPEEETKPKTEEGEMGTAGEMLVSNGLASTLSLLRTQGLVKDRTPEELEREKRQKERDAWLTKQRQRDTDREEEKRRSRAAGDSKTQQQREYENRMREQQAAHEAMDAFKDYKPVVDIKYHDEFGRDQTPKEAWKQLSHSFHGKGSGKAKTEKRLKKIADEKKREAMASGDTPLATARAFAARAERLGSATMVLSVGNKGSAPVLDDEDLLNELNKDEPTKKSKTKAKAKNANKSGSTPAPSVFNDIPMRPVPLPAAQQDRSASPAPRAGFAPIRSFSPAVPSPLATSSTLDAKSVMIPVSIKRKADGEAPGSPASKKQA